MLCFHLHALGANPWLSPFAALPIQEEGLQFKSAADWLACRQAQRRGDLQKAEKHLRGDILPRDEDVADAPQDDLEKALTMMAVQHPLTVLVPLVATLKFKLECAECPKLARAWENIRDRTST